MRTKLVRQAPQLLAHLVQQRRNSFEARTRCRNLVSHFCDGEVDGHEHLSRLVVQLMRDASRFTLELLAPQTLGSWRAILVGHVSDCRIMRLRCQCPRRE